MLDPGSMGTLLIGLDAINNETSAGRARRPGKAPRRRRSIRAALASGLRQAADVLQPQPVASRTQHPSAGRRGVD